MEDLVSAPWLRRLIIAALLAACVLLGFRVMDPFIVPLVWAAILAFVSWPAYQWLRDKCRGHTTVAAVRSESTRLNSSHVEKSYAVFCLKKKRRFPDQL